MLEGNQALFMKNLSCLKKVKFAENDVVFETHQKRHGIAEKPRSKGKRRWRTIGYWEHSYLATDKFDC